MRGAITADTLVVTSIHDEQLVDDIPTSKLLRHDVPVDVICTPTRVGSECGVSGVGSWVLGAGCWVLGVGCRVLGVGCRVLGVGCWNKAVGYGDIIRPLSWNTNGVFA